jgi:hypothetical protein
MMITGARLPESDAAQALLADMADRRQYARQAIDGALDRLAELPSTPGWRPTDAEELRAVVDVYSRGMLACGLVTDRASGRPEFYTVRDFAPRGARVEYLDEIPSLGLLLRVQDTLVASRVVFSVLDQQDAFGEHAYQHAEVVLRLREVAEAVTRARLNEQKKKKRG